MAYKYNPLLKSGLQEVTASDAASTTYDNAASGLAATNVQNAIDEVVDNTIPYPINTYQSFLATAGSSPGGTIISQNYVIGPVVLIRAKVSVTTIRARVVTAAGAGTAILGIYKYNGTDFILVAQAVGTVNLTLNTVQELSFATTQILEPGIYSMVMQSTVAITMEYANHTTCEPILGNAPTMGTDCYFNITYFPSVYTGTLPLSFAGTAITAILRVPHLLLKTA